MVPWAVVSPKLACSSRIAVIVAHQIVAEPRRAAFRRGTETGSSKHDHLPMSGCPESSQTDCSGSDPNQGAQTKIPADCEDGRNNEATEDVLETGHARTHPPDPSDQGGWTKWLSCRAMTDCTASGSGRPCAARLPNCSIRPRASAVVMASTRAGPGPGLRKVWGAPRAANATEPAGA